MRWILGEGMRSQVLTWQQKEALTEKQLLEYDAAPVALFDMYYPECFGAPGSLYSADLYCGDADAGGVQTNAGVITRLFATLVDGATTKIPATRPLLRWW